MNKTKEILDFMIDYYQSKNKGWLLKPEFRTSVGFESGERYIDLLAVNPYQHKRVIICYEIKISMSDFRSDLSQFGDKHRPILEFANEFYYLLHEDIIKEATINMIPAECGLCTIQKGKLIIKKKAPKRIINEFPYKYLMAFLQNFHKEQKIIPLKYRDKNLTEEELKKITERKFDEIIKDKIFEKLDIEKRKLKIEFEKLNKDSIERLEEAKRLENKLCSIFSCYNLDYVKEQVQNMKQTIREAKEIKNNILNFLLHIKNFSNFLNDKNTMQKIKSFTKFLEDYPIKKEGNY